MTKKVWLVTGASRGLGLTLVNYLLGQGESVVATSRDKNDLITKISEENENFLPVNLNLTDETAIAKIVEQSLTKFGRIDVLVNNAGYMVAGALEDTTDEEVRACFDINVFGTINMLRAVAPIMRKQQSGHIINTSSIAGLYAGAFESTYSATKFAINGISAALSEELRPYNVHVTNVMPGFLRTEFLTPTSFKMANLETSAYKESIEQRLTFASKMNGTQPGDPFKVAKVYQQIVAMDTPPTELMLGSDAYQIALKVANQKIMMTEENEILSTMIDFSEASKE